MITFTPVTDILYTLEYCDSDILQTIYQQLPSQPWVTEPPADGNWHLSVSSIAHENTSMPMQNLVSSLRDNSFKQQLLNTLFTNTTFTGDWEWPNWQVFDRVTELHVNWVRTPPGYIQQPFHTDNRSQVALGMIYFILDDDPDQSTYFDTDPPRPYQRIPTGLGRGWCVINHDRALHRAMNNTDNYRYCLKFSLNLKLR